MMEKWSGSLQVKHSREETVGAEPTPDHQFNLCPYWKLRASGLKKETR